jgi:D-sedoheptulose 7-phosphate isomerase
MRVIALSGSGNLVELPGDKVIHMEHLMTTPRAFKNYVSLILHCLCDATDCLLSGVN